MSRLSALVAPLLALVAAFLLTALPSPAQGAASASQSAKTAIGVRVTNEAGKVVPGAEVILFNADGKKVAMRHTNVSGRATFVPVKPGEYLVRAGKLGQGKGQEIVTAEDGKLAKAAVHIKKK